MVCVRDFFKQVNGLKDSFVIKNCKSDPLNVHQKLLNLSQMFIKKAYTSNIVCPGGEEKISHLTR